MKINAKDYATRDDLESYLVSVIGNNIQKNKISEHSIEGTRQELKNLSLSDLSTVYGVRCVITDTPTDELVKQNVKAPDRKIHENRSKKTA